MMLNVNCEFCFVFFSNTNDTNVFTNDTKIKNIDIFEISKISEIKN